MYDRIDTLRMASSLTTHAENRQKLIAQNVANADTPGYRAQDLGAFADSYSAAPGLEMRATRSGHVTGASWSSSSHTTDTNGEPSPNGNTVSLEDEMIRSAQAKRQFDIALAVTRSSGIRTNHDKSPFINRTRSFGDARPIGSAAPCLREYRQY